MEKKLQPKIRILHYLCADNLFFSVTGVLPACGGTAEIKPADLIRVMPAQEDKLVFSL